MKEDGRWLQSWYADDSVCAGSLDDILAGSLGPSSGYFPEHHKSYLVVAPNITHLVSDAFAGLGISIVYGHSFLRGVIGEATRCEDLIQLKVNVWVHSINALAKATRKSPQVAFTAVVKSLQFEWSKWFATVGLCCSSSMMPLLLTLFQLYLILMFLS